MADIELVRAHSVPIAEAKRRVQQTAEELDAEYHLRSEWRGNTLLFDRAGLHGEIQVTGSEIRLETTLSFLLKPLRAALVERIEQKFEKLFPGSKSGSRANKPSRTKVPSPR